MPPSRYIVRVAWDRMGWPTLPRLGGGMFWAGHRAVSQTILSNMCVRFSCLRWPARRGKVSRHFCTFADVRICHFARYDLEDDQGVARECKYLVALHR